MTRPWMPLYVADYLADTAHLRALESGAYLHLIMHYWQHGGLPDDDRHLANIAKMTLKEFNRARPILEKLFQPGWKHKRIEFELTEAARMQAAARKAGLASAAKRATTVERPLERPLNDRTNETPTECQRLKPSPSPRKIERKEGREDKTAGAASSFAFDGWVIHLNEKHFSDWTKAFSNLDLLGELTARDAWLGSERATDADRKNWFISTSKYLANRNMEAKAKVSNGTHERSKFQSALRELRASAARDLGEADGGSTDGLLPDR